MVKDKRLDLVGGVFTETVPKLCEMLKEFSDEEKYSAIGASMQTILSAMVNYCLYGDYMIDDTDDSIKWQITIAENLVSILKEDNE